MIDSQHPKYADMQKAALLLQHGLSFYYDQMPWDVQIRTLEPWNVQFQYRYGNGPWMYTLCLNPEYPLPAWNALMLAMIYQRHHGKGDPDANTPTCLAAHLL